MYEVSVTRIDERVDDALDGRLEERAECLLCAENPLAVLECVRDAAVGRAARDLVGDVEADPDDELEGQVRPAAWQAPGCLGDEARHDSSILTRSSRANDSLTRTRAKRESADQLG